MSVGEPAEVHAFAFVDYDNAKPSRREKILADVVANVDELATCATQLAKD